MKIMHKNVLSILLLLNLTAWCCSYSVQPIKFELFDDKFRLSISNDPDIKWVTFNVNINKKFEGFEMGQLSGRASIPRDRKWSYEFDRRLEDNDIVYVWLSIQRNRLIFRDKKDPIHVADFKKKNCAPNCDLTTNNNLVTESRVGLPTDSTDITQPNKVCMPTISEVPKTFGGPYCRDDVIFSEEFDTINSKYWTNEVRLPPKQSEFILYNGTLGVENGILNIEAELNTKNLKRDSIDLGERCTSINVATECRRTPYVGLILPPIITGLLSTRNKFFFKYGRIVVRARMPKGDWLYPLISLQPETPIYGEKSGEIRVAYIHGNHELNWQNQNINGGRLYGGAIVNQGDIDSTFQFMKDITLPNVTHFGDDFHLYSLTWTREELIMAVDGNEYGRVESNFKKSLNTPIWNKGGSNAPLDQMFYITLGLSAGGTRDFPDTEGKPWTNTGARGSWNFYKLRELWFGTWEQPSLEVDYVKVYAV